MGSACEWEPLVKLGEAARKARLREGPVLVPASSISSWYWCGLKAWHNVTLFNAGWLSSEEVQEHLDALAVLWYAEIMRSSRPEVVAGKLVHGEVDVLALEGVLQRLTLSDVKTLVMKGVLRGLIDPDDYKRQVERLDAASDPVEYFKREEWPLFRLPLDCCEIIGVPDGIEWGKRGVVLLEVKSSSRPERYEGGAALRSAKVQLASYYAILSSRWRVEKAILVVKGLDGSIYRRVEYHPEQLEAIWRTRGLPAARRLASFKAPSRRVKRLCGKCELGFEPPSDT
ncbi:hypothetical protein Pyrfu_1080 [Pyrolobus fumarii 1A]|uniref:PD-(D/E)XK endonuclease-like domain-containing protein n=1 Tax=Pyrolobus fumarii (strain DSM 11204 / 1A) TaxID=694429 RepID=G0EF51_PYRF1|nr:hypothetical protein [Pyrolobus fumarii]AEM38948.1 hypothetical protein Pyrfu_1080 [Pyrolobus fumarii 1A]